MKFRGIILKTFLLFGILIGHATEIYVSPNGGTKNTGKKDDPVSFETAIKMASKLLKESGVPDERITILVLGGHYRFERPISLGEEFKGTASSPIVIKAAKGGKVVFDGSVLVDANKFKKVTKAKEKARLSKKVIDKIVAVTIKNEAMIERFNESLMLNLNFNGKNYLPSVFPNEEYADFVEKTVTAEVTPPGIPVGEQDYGLRAGYVPYLEEGKSRGWKGSLEEPRGARAKIDNKENEMAGTWVQWENELKRNNKRNQLTGFIEANWLLSSQPIYAASGKDECLHLSRALGYGWAWRKNDKQFRVFGMLCELDAPGEWHFDPLTNRLFIYPPEPMTKDTKISLSVANGFMALENTKHVQIIGLSVTNVGGGNVYALSGENNLVASCDITNSTAIGVDILGKNNSVIGCDLIDLNIHARLGGGIADGNEITPANNKIENCHIYQKQFKHEKVNIAINGCGNVFRNNLVHNSIGQALVVKGNEQLIELNEFFNIGFEEGDGGAVYSGADMGGYGNVYRYNFFHHLIHCPGKVGRSGIHLDDGQSGATCIGNVFYKSAAKGIFTFGGAGHTIYDNVLLEGDIGIYLMQVSGEKERLMAKEIKADPNHHRRGTKEDMIGRVEARIGDNGWAKPHWINKHPTFNKIMSDTETYGRFWPIYLKVVNNFSYGNGSQKMLDYRVEKGALEKCVIEDYKEVTPSDFVDYEQMNFQFKDKTKFPAIPFDEIGLKKDEYRQKFPDKVKYRNGVRAFFKGIGSMPGTKKQINTSELVE
ncbi:right-handed parallel beta-helix repeat-containing protein [Flavivirga eckloniae]|uniref:Right handed beta helix domain-containing protein n=1 Tax=Flavivirga eckloniae TaxID=1803846 RepID=A0A2K9PPJ0_9FLAO|nr:right-handed parallel beta-helix repeat-containing protein [Flavivirga eckloniae]AUP78972.1 hypothetical protein C1H87_09775 [Flavivirga eckloniae]